MDTNETWEKKQAEMEDIYKHASNEGVNAQNTEETQMKTQLRNGQDS